MSSAFYSPEGYFLKIGCKCDLQGAREKGPSQHAAECWYIWHDGGHSNAFADTPSEVVGWLRFLEKEARRNDKPFEPHVQYRKYWRGTNDPLTQEEWEVFSSSKSLFELEDIYYTVNPQYSVCTKTPSLEELAEVLDPTIIEKYDVTDRFWSAPHHWNPFEYSAPGASWRYEMD